MRNIVLISRMIFRKNRIELFKVANFTNKLELGIIMIDLKLATRIELIFRSMISGGFPTRTINHRRILICIAYHFFKNVNISRSELVAFNFCSFDTVTKVLKEGIDEDWFYESDDLKDSRIKLLKLTEKSQDWAVKYFKEI